MFYLYVTAPGMAARKLSLDRPVTTVGRSSMNDLPISDKMLSRQHARIVRDTDGGLTVEDLGSRNGTFLNGERLTTVQVLKPGDRITVGGVTLKVESESTTRVRIEGGGEDPLDNTILKASAELLRAHATETDPRLPAEQLGKLIESLRVVNELTIELLRDISVDELLRFLMDKVFETLKPDRGLVLLRQRVHRRARARGGARGGGNLRRGHPAVEDAGGRGRREAQRPAPHGHDDGLGRQPGRLDPPLGHQVRPRGAARERGRGRRSHLRRLSASARAPSRRPTCAS